MFSANTTISCNVGSIAANVDLASAASSSPSSSSPPSSELRTNLATYLEYKTKNCPG